MTKPTPAPASDDRNLEAMLDDELRRRGVRYFSAREALWLPKTLPRARMATMDDVVDDGVVSADDLVRNLADVVKVADELREAYGRPVRIASGYRPRWYNQAVAGAEGGQHPLGKALDIIPEGSPDERRAFQRLALAAWDAGRFGGFGVYLWGRIHVDTRTRKTTWTRERVKALR